MRGYRNRSTDACCSLPTSTTGGATAMVPRPNWRRAMSFWFTVAFAFLCYLSTDPRFGSTSGHASALGLRSIFGLGEAEEEDLGKGLEQEDDDYEDDEDDDDDVNGDGGGGGGGGSKKPHRGEAKEHKGQGQSEDGAGATADADHKDADALYAEAAGALSEASKRSQRSEDEQSRAAEEGGINEHNQNDAHRAAARGDVDLLSQIAIADADQLRAGDANGFTPLHEGAVAGNVDVVRMLVDHGADIHGRSRDGATPLFFAVEIHGNDHPVVSYLRSLGALYGVPEGYQEPQGEDAAAAADEPGAAHRAASNADVDALREIAQHRGLHRLHDRDANGWSPLHEAVRAGHLDVVEFLLEHGANINERTREGSTPLHIAIDTHGHHGDDGGDQHPIVSYMRRIGAVEVAPREEEARGFEDEGGAEELLRTDAHRAAATGDVDALLEIARVDKEQLFARDKNGWQPLHEATLAGHVDVVRMLVEQHGADINARTADGATAAFIAVEFHGGDNPLIHYLESIQAQYVKPEEDQSEESLRVAHTAASEADMDKLQEIAKVNRDRLHASDDNGWQPLHEAVRAGHVDVVEFLVENGADVNERTMDGATPLFLATEFNEGDHPLIRYLKDLGGVELGPEL